MPDGVPPGILLWRRPTLARPVAVLPSGLQRFTSVFGMGTGGATALLSPEFCAETSAQNSGGVIRDRLLKDSSLVTCHSSFVSKNASSLAPTYRFRKVARRTATPLQRLSFNWIFHFPLLPRKLSEQVIGKVKDQAERVISTPELNTLLCLHPEPINVVVYHDPSGRTHLGIGLALRCFQRLSFPNIATQHCS